MSQWVNKTGGESARHREQISHCQAVKQPGGKRARGRTSQGVKEPGGESANGQNGSVEKNNPNWLHTHCGQSAALLG